MRRPLRVSDTSPSLQPAAVSQPAPGLAARLLRGSLREPGRLALARAAGRPGLAASGLVPGGPGLAAPGLAAPGLVPGGPGLAAPGLVPGGPGLLARLRTAAPGRGPRRAVLLSRSDRAGCFG
jgi:hypothetical protein